MTRDRMVKKYTLDDFLADEEGFVNLEDVFSDWDDINLLTTIKRCIAHAIAGQKYVVLFAADEFAYSENMIISRALRNIEMNYDEYICQDGCVVDTGSLVSFTLVISADYQPKNNFVCLTLNPFVLPYIKHEDFIDGNRLNIRAILDRLLEVTHDKRPNIL